MFPRIRMPDACRRLPGKSGARRIVLAPIAFVIALGCIGARALAEERARIPLDELRTFAEVLEQVRTAYVEPIDDRRLLENAIKGMLSELDPYSTYLDRKAFAQLREQTSGQVAGIGVDLGLDHGRISIVTPFDDSPAARQGVLPGDIVLSIDRAPTKGMLLSEAIERLRGPAGTAVALELQREGRPRQTLRLVRANLTITSVRAGIPEFGVGYIRLSQFQIDTAKDMLAALTRLRALNGGRLRGLVLDLRNNPGGVVQASVDVVDAFVDSGLIVSTRGRIEGAQFSFSATRGDVTQGLPLVVLVNEGSASAAEIVAGALQDHRRATIVGARTYGKGSVQTVLTLSGDRGIKLTTALYYTPTGRSFQNAGIAPDIAVAGTRAPGIGDGVAMLGSTASAPQRYAGSDAQLAAALNVLRTGGPARPAAPRAAPPRPTTSPGRTNR